VDEAIWQLIVVLLVVTVVAMAVVLVAVARQVGSLLLQVAPQRPGSIEGGPAIGAAVEVPGLSSVPAVVTFVSPGCAPCEALTPAIPAVARHYPELTLLAAIVGGDGVERDRLAADLSPYGRKDLERLQAEWGVPGTPFAVGIDSDGLARLSGVVNNLDQLEALAESLLALPAADAEADDEHAHAHAHDAGRVQVGFAGNGKAALVPVPVGGASIAPDNDEEVDG
jgi:thiol-disulfide isomerase/thioredoxin